MRRLVYLNSRSQFPPIFRVLADMLAPHRKGKSNKPQPRASVDSSQGGNEDNSSPPPVVLPSSTELFYFYAQSLEQCAKLSTGQPLFELATLHKKWLRIYAGKWGVDLLLCLTFLFYFLQMKCSPPMRKSQVFLSTFGNERTIN